MVAVKVAVGCSVVHSQVVTKARLRWTDEAVALLTGGRTEVSDLWVHEGSRHWDDRGSKQEDQRTRSEEGAR